MERRAVLSWLVDYPLRPIVPTGAEIVLPNALKPLARLFDEPKPNVLIVVGTGISIGATNDPRSSWKGLLLDGVDRIDRLGLKKEKKVLQGYRNLIEDAFTGAFDLDEILQRAESIIKALGEGGSPFQSWLADSVGALQAEPSRRQALDAIAALARAGALVLTTNYDDLLYHATGFHPVTWEEPNKILQVINRQREGIIHIHGHWSRPSSVILGKTSYERIKAAGLPQTQLRSLWLHWHWLYLGCGSGGLDDPNIGALLKWADDTGLNESALPDYFLSTAPTIDMLPERLGKSTTLVKHAYDDHAVDLPRLLVALMPEARSAPFELLGPNARRMRKPGESPQDSPFPSWQEYVGNVVPRIEADEDVAKRLDEHGWVLVLDVASVGKSTLAYRIATRTEFSAGPAYYLLLSHLTVDEEKSVVSPQAALARLSRPGVLFIIDDANQQPELAHILWQQWRERPNGSKLLILATRVGQAINRPGTSSLLSLEASETNPAIRLQATPQDLVSIANYVLARLRGPATPKLNAPPDVLESWHKSFGREIGAFVVAVSHRSTELLRGDFTLPESAGAAWVKDRHLQGLTPQDVENAICLAVYGEQALEIAVPAGCLPHSHRIDRLLRSGLADKVPVREGRPPRYILREPGWGRLILASVDHEVARLPLLAQTSAKDMQVVVAVTARLGRAGEGNDLKLYWQLLANNVDKVIAHVFDAPLASQATFLTAAGQQDQHTLVSTIWAALAKRCDKLVELALMTSLDVVAWYLEVARDHGQHETVEHVWRGLAKEPRRLADQAFRTQLHFLAAFLTKAERRGEDELVRDLWAALAANPTHLLERAYAGSLNDLGAFMRTAADKGPKEILESLWLALGEESDHLAEWALSGSLGDLDAFLRTTIKYGKPEVVQKLWDSLAAQPTRLADRAVESPLSAVSAFLDTAKKYGQTLLSDALWDALAARSDRLAEKASVQPPNFVMSFLVKTPEKLRAEIIQRLRVEDWSYGPYRNERFSCGASGLASYFDIHGRDDLKNALVDTILRRRDPADFSDTRSALHEIGRLLSLTEANQQAAVLELLRIVCTEKWLDNAYTFGSTNGLVAAIHAIAVHQPPDVIRWLWSLALGRRLETELANAARRTDQDLSSAVQLLGASQLAGWSINRRALVDVSLDRIARLPGTTKHRREAIFVERWQRQLWLGLRAWVWIDARPLYVERAAIDETLELWRKNIEGSGDWPGSRQTPDTTPHRINVSMVNWLEHCVRSGRLLPSREPLWVLAGFERHLPK